MLIIIKDKDTLTDAMNNSFRKSLLKLQIKDMPAPPKTRRLISVKSKKSICLPYEIN